MSTETAANTLRHVTWAFATPIVTVDFPGCESLNAQLATTIRGMEREDGGRLLSNRGGWQSKATLHASTDEAMVKLFSMIDAAVHGGVCDVLGHAPDGPVARDWTIRAWANINRRYHHNSVHYHVGGFWSGVYYIEVPPNLPDGHGSIRFKCPSPGAILADTIKSPRQIKQMFLNTIGVQPQPGMLLMFPSWLEHSVEPFVADGERISVSFDVAYK